MSRAPQPKLKLVLVQWYFTGVQQCSSTHVQRLTLSSALKLEVLAFTGERLVLHDFFQTIGAVRSPQPWLQPRHPHCPNSAVHCSLKGQRGIVFEIWKELAWFLSGFLLDSSLGMSSMMQLSEEAFFVDFLMLCSAILVRLYCVKKVS